jgi:catechol 2,3-dioxygenase-like lactoylglutathione lyase family enzyme
MRCRGLCHIELNAPDYENAIQFFDRMFGWLGCSSFSTLAIGYISPYYTAFPHSYIGIQPSPSSEHLEHEKMRCGINHVALWAKKRREFDSFYADFLKPQQLVVLDPPDWCPEYSPGYHAVFFWIRMVSGGVSACSIIAIAGSPSLSGGVRSHGLAKSIRSGSGVRFFESQRRLPQRGA